MTLPTRHAKAPAAYCAFTLVITLEKAPFVVDADISTWQAQPFHFSQSLAIRIKAATFRLASAHQLPLGSAGTAQQQQLSRRWHEYGACHYGFAQR